MRAFGRRTLVKMLASLPLAAASAGYAAEIRRVGGARILVMDERVWIQVRIRGQGPFSFVIDTGADMNLIRKDLAQRLGLQERHDQLASGVGGTQRFTIYGAPDVAFGNVGVGAIDFSAYDAAELPIHREAMGALSASMLTVADCDLDFEALEWRIYPDGRGDRNGFEALPSSIRGSVRRIGATPVLVDAAIGGRTYRLELDTGSPPQISLFPGATKRSGLWNGDTPYAPIQHSGIGGRGAHGRLVRVPEVRLGTITFERPLISLSDPEAPSVGGADGLLGLGLIQRLNLSSDVKGGRLWAQRNSRPAAPEHYGLSGLWVDAKDGRLVVTDVSPLSPAAAAGLQVGDEIPGVALRDWVRKLAGMPGEVIEVAYERGGKPATARLTLRPYL
ncbi:MAG: hypothetical protein QOH04_2270 [Sphingomonadales bacterium]|jgi:serine protease Do|nr:hypothetical protein [Sphingomonadales bacterium]